MKEKTAQLSILTTSFNVVEAANAEPGNPKCTGRINTVDLPCANGTAQIRHQCRKTAVLSCHRFQINSGVEKTNKM